MGDNDVDLEANELCHEIGDALGFTLAIAIHDGDGLFVTPAEVAQPLREGGGPRARCRYQIAGRRRRR
jgi:hypothetical protein